jgi:hypothetical protein
MDAERFWVVRASLIALAVCFGFYIVAPTVLRFPLDTNSGETTRILQIIVPVFVAYLSAAAAFLFVQRQPPSQLAQVNNNTKLLRLLTRGPVYLTSAGWILATAAFWYSNRQGGPPGMGMSLDQYCWFVSSLLGVLASTTGLIVAKIFPGEADQNN